MWVKVKIKVACILYCVLLIDDLFVCVFGVLVVLFFVFNEGYLVMGFDFVLVC